jgi:hypothetical protein
MACPPLSCALVVAEDAMLAAQISCALATPGHYLPIIEGPRFGKAPLPTRPPQSLRGNVRDHQFRTHRYSCHQQR